MKVRVREDKVEKEVPLCPFSGRGRGGRAKEQYFNTASDIGGVERWKIGTGRAETMAESSVWVY